MPSTSTSPTVSTGASWFATSTSVLLFSSTSFCITQSTFVISRLLSLFIYSFPFSFVIAMTIQIKSEVKKWLKIIDLNYSSLSASLLATLLINKKKSLNSTFITLKFLIFSYMQEKIDLICVQCLCNPFIKINRA